MYDVLDGHKWFKCSTKRYDPFSCIEKLVSCRFSDGTNESRIISNDLSDNNLYGDVTSYLNLAPLMNCNSNPSPYIFEGTSLTCCTFPSSN